MTALSDAGFPKAAMAALYPDSGPGESVNALRDQLAHMPPAQAARLARELAAGAALLFVRVLDATEEKRASLALLKHSEGSVYVCDFDGP